MHGTSNEHWFSANIRSTLNCLSWRIRNVTLLPLECYKEKFSIKLCCVGKKEKKYCLFWFFFYAAYYLIIKLFSLTHFILCVYRKSENWVIASYMYNKFLSLNTVYIREISLFAYFSQSLTNWEVHSARAIRSEWMNWNSAVIDVCFLFAILSKMRQAFPIK